MDKLTLSVKSREAGKKTARAARRDREVPCVLYGHGIDAVLFQVPELDLRPLIYTAEKRTVEITVQGGATQTCILKSLVMHPITDRPFHADFLALNADEPVRVTVPLQFVGAAPALREGLMLSYALHDLEITALPRDIPGHIDVDVSALTGVHDAVRFSDLTLPEGVTAILDADATVVAVVPPMAEEAEIVAPETAEAAEAAAAPEA